MRRWGVNVQKTKMMKGKTWLTLAALGLAAASSAWAQKPPETEAEFDKNYQMRIRMEYIGGVYIPRDLGDAFAQLHKLIDRDAKTKFKTHPEDDAVRQLHFSFGRWIIYNWGFYEGSRLSHSLREMGVYHPDDMARFIIRSYHRSLNQRPIEAKAQIEALNAQRQKEREERLMKGQILHQEKRPAKAADGGRP